MRLQYCFSILVLVFGICCYLTINFIDQFAFTTCSHVAKMACSATFYAKRKPHIDSATNKSIAFEPIFDEFQFPSNYLYEFSFNFEAKQVSAGVKLLKYLPFFKNPIRTASFINDRFGCIILQSGSLSLSQDLLENVAKMPQAEHSTITNNDLVFETYDPLQKLAEKEISDPSQISRSIIIIHKDKVVAEAYGHGFNRDTPQLSWSAAKSLANALIGIRHKQGKLNVFNKTIVEQFENEEFAKNWAKDKRSELKLEHLLQMSSGLKFDENYLSATSDVMTMLHNSKDCAAIALNRSLEDDKAPLGSKFEYKSGTSNALCHLLRLTFDKLTDYWQFYKTELFDKIGMKGIIEMDESGNLVCSSYSYLTPLSFARFGLLYLRNGVWLSGEEILPPGWVNFTSSTAPGSQGFYGAHFWKLGYLKYCDKENAEKIPNDIYFAFGAQGQYVFIIPSRQVVITRMGTTSSVFDVFGSWKKELFITRVLDLLPSN